MSKDEELRPKGEQNELPKEPSPSTESWEREIKDYKIGDGVVKEGYQPNDPVDTTMPPEGED